MKNTMKKVVVMLLAMMMVLGTMTTAFAGILTINSAEGKATSGHSYKVYQIFTGDESDGVLSNVKYGANYGETGTAVPETVLDEIKDADAFAETAFKALKGDPVATLNADNSFSAELADGYYLIVDDTTADIDNPDTYSKYMIQVVGSVEMNPKSSTAPGFEKKVKDTNDTTGETSDWQDSADYDVNDLVPFKLTATVPANYADYDTYYMSFNDTLTNMALQASTIVVKVDGTELDDSAYYIYGNQTKFQVVIYDLKDTAAKAGSTVTVEYSAKLLDNAVIGSTGNPNVANLTYSNNPENEQKGTPSEGDKPGTPDEPETPDTPDTPENPDEPETPDDTDDTPDDKNIVFTYQVIVNKVDEDKAPLAGAGFTLYKKDSKGNWNEVDTLTAEAVEKDGKVVSYTAAFQRLDDGDYKLVESTTPAGYNTIADVEFTITATHDTTSDDPTLTALDGGNLGTGVVSTGAITTDIKNEKGATLPTTGGMGTTVIYVAGMILVLFAGVMLVTRRRMAR